MLIVFYILLTLIAYIIAGEKLGSLISLEDYAFARNSTYTSKYFNFSEEDGPIKLSSQLIDYPYQEKNFSVQYKVKEKDSIEIIKENSYLPFFSKIEIFKDDSVMIPGKDYSIDYFSETPYITEDNLNIDNNTAKMFTNNTSPPNMIATCAASINKIVYKHANVTAKSIKGRIVKMDSYLGFTFAITEENGGRVRNNTNNTNNRGNRNNDVGRDKKTTFRLLQFESNSKKNGGIKITNKKYEIRDIYENTNKTAENDIIDFWIIKEGDNFYTDRIYSDALGMKKDTKALLALLTEDDVIYLFTLNNRDNIKNSDNSTENNSDDSTENNSDSTDSDDDFDISDTIKFHSIIKFKEQIPVARLDDNFNITKVGLWNNVFILGSMNSGLFLFKYKKNTNVNNVNPIIRNDRTKVKNEFKYYQGIEKFSNSSGKSINFHVKDFYLNSKTIYCIIHKYGMRIFSFESGRITPFEIYHPYMLSFEKKSDLEGNGKVETNPTDGTIENYYNFVRIFIDNKNNAVDEFLIELILLNRAEDTPAINKLYLTKRNLNDATDIVNDGKYSYIYDNLSKVIYMIRSFANPLAPTLIFKLDMKKTFLPQGSDYLVHKLSKTDDDITKLLFHSDNAGSNGQRDKSSMVIVTINTKEKAKMKCTFSDAGNYIVKVLTDDPDIAEVTGMNKIGLSRVTNSIYLQVDADSSYNYVIIAIVCSCFVVLVILIIVIICKTNKKNNQGAEVNIVNNANNANLDANNRHSRSNSNYERSNNFDDIKPRRADDEEIVIEIFNNKIN